MRIPFYAARDPFNAAPVFFPNASIAVHGASEPSNGTRGIPHAVQEPYSAA